MNRKILLGIVLVIIVGLIVLIESTKNDVSSENLRTEIELEAPVTIQTDPLGVGNETVSEDQTDTDTTNSELNAKRLARIEEKSKEYGRAIELVDPEGYINTDPITIRELVGKKVIIVDFWTYSCINCQRTLPYLTSWYDKYHDQGLEIIGVHTPEFKFEQEYDNVLQATKKFGVEYPVVQDNDKQTWTAYENHYWPRKYIIDIDGFIVYDHIGEGAYEETEKKIKELLMERAEVLGEDSSELEDITVDEEKINLNISLGRTPETYLGYGFAVPRGQQIGNENKEEYDVKFDYTLPSELEVGKLERDTIYLGGGWIRQDGDVLAAGDSQMVLDYIARSVNVVAGSEMGSRVEIQVDGDYLTKSQAGADVLFDDEVSYIEVSVPGLYHVIEGDFERHVLTLSTTSDDLHINSFTFG